MKNPYLGMTIATLAEKFGPATCGCVALSHTSIRQTLTFEQMEKTKAHERRGWHQCPICRGTGVDPRVKVAVDSMSEALACR